jgi:hypothetical protein
MSDSDWLERRLAPYSCPAGRSLRAGAFRSGRFECGLRARVDARVEEAVRRFETDRLLYDIEVEALHAWLRRLAQFDAYCARRDRPPA